MIKNKTNLPYISLVALTVFGNGALTFKFSSVNGADFITALVALIITVAAFALFLKLALFIKKRIEPKENFKTAWSVIFLLEGLLSLSFALFSLVSLTEISLNTFAKEIKIGVIILGFILTVAGMVYANKKVFLKFSLIVFPVVFGLTLLIFLFGTPYMSIKYLYIDSFSQVFNLERFLEPLISWFLPVCLPLIVICIDKPSSIVIGATIGSGFLVLTILNTILIFGSAFASELFYPYAHAVGTVSIGELFSRMDASFYPTIFFPGIIRISVQTLAAVKLFFKAKKYKKIAINY